MISIDQFLKSEKPVTGKTTQACDTYGVHSHAFIVDLFGNGKTSIDGGHFHVIRKGVIRDVMDDARSVHNHDMIGSPVGPLQPSYGVDNSSPAFRAGQGEIPGARELPPKVPILFVGLRESLDGILRGDPSLVWSKLASQATPDEIKVLDSGLKAKAAEFRERFDALLDDLLRLASPEKAGVVRHLAGYENQPLSPAMLPSPAEFSLAFGGNPAGELFESQYRAKSREYMDDLGSELQAIILMNEGKTYEEWAEENREEIEETCSLEKPEIAGKKAIELLSRTEELLSGELISGLSDASKHFRQDTELRDLSAAMTAARNLVRPCIVAVKARIALVNMPAG